MVAWERYIGLQVSEFFAIYLLGWNKHGQMLTSSIIYAQLSSTLSHISSLLSFHLVSRSFGFSLSRNDSQAMIGALGRVT